MSGTTRTVQQPLDSHSMIAVLGMATAALAAAVAIAWGSANLVRTAPAQLPPPAAISDPVLRDLGARDIGVAAQAPLSASDPALRDLGARDLGAASVSISVTQGAPGAYRPAITSGGSSTLVKDDVVIKTRAAEGFLPGFLFDSDQRRQQSITSSEGAPATRHAGLRAQ